ncbi:unnamed protein product [Linum tenue]|uniref:Uncharacterized protein n=1 Tax=Linum tenue TaxID=586396 RepID=A0AAV0HR78_9ROSI|nr:unnamed protein product [Linum tenue]
MFLTLFMAESQVPISPSLRRCRRIKREESFGKRKTMERHRLSFCFGRDGLRDDEKGEIGRRDSADQRG